MVYARYEWPYASNSVEVVGIFSTRSPQDWPTGDYRLGIGVQLDPDFVLAYRANPDDPRWANVYPPHDPALGFLLPYTARRMVLELETHAAEPPLGDAEGWDYVEQGGSEFGLLPARVQPIIFTAEADHDRVFGPVLNSIPDGWNMIRVSSRDLRPDTDETLIRLDIWPIAGPAGRTVIRGTSGQAPPPPIATPPHHAGALPRMSTASVGSDELKNESVLIRVDYDDFEAWNDVCRAAIAPEPNEGFRADLIAVDNPAYLNNSVEELLERIGEPPPFYVFVADRVTLTHPEHPILAINIGGTTYPDEHGQTLRVLPSAMSWIENNLALGNADFADFVRSAGPDGIYRGE